MRCDVNIIEWIKNRYGIKKNIQDLLILILQGKVCDYNKNHDRWGRFAKGKGGSGKRYYSSGGKRIEIAKAIQKDKKVVGGGKEAQKAYDAIMKQEPETTKALIGVVKSIGAEMAGLEFCVKGGKSLGEKLERNMKKYGYENEKMAMKEMTDVLRYTVLAEHDKIADSTENIIRAMEKKGYKTFQVENKWLENGKQFRSAYHGIHLLFQNKQGTIFEMQIHSPETFDIKMNKTHKDYEIARGIKSTPEEKEAANERMMKCWDDVPLPKGIERIKDVWGVWD